MIAAGLLGAGVVGGDHGEVGQLGSGPAHQRPLRPVPVAAGTDHGDQAAGGQLPGRPEHVLDRVGGVGVVDQHGELLTLVDRLHPARDPAGAGQRRRPPLRVDTPSDRPRPARPARWRR